MVASGVAPCYQKLEAEVQKSYPDLRLVVRNGQPLFRGSFPVRHDGDEIDRFQIEISFPDGINRLPTIREVGGRVPRDSDHHVNVASGDICTDVPELILLRGQPSLVEYLDGAVRNFFLSQTIVASGQTWPFGQWDHGKKGLLQAYGELLSVTGERQIRAYLDYVASKKPKGHWLCPCGSTKRLRDCHAKQITELRERIPRRIAASALKRLIECP
jgi:hypothetical protein